MERLRYQGAEKRACQGHSGGEQPLCKEDSERLFSALRSSVSQEAPIEGCIEDSEDHIDWTENSERESNTYQQRLTRAKAEDSVPEVQQSDYCQ